MHPSSLPKNQLMPPAVGAVAPYFALALAIAAVYGNCFDNVFLFDDDLLIKLNLYLRGWSHIGDILRGSTTSGAYITGGFYRPVQMLLYLLVFHLGGGTVFFFHLLNVSLHGANAGLMYRLGSKLGFHRVGVFLTTLLWSLHPLHTEAVSYMSATADPLFAFFCLLALVILVPTISPERIFHVIPLFVLGLLSKETAVMFPLLVMACIFFTSTDRLYPRIYFRTWPLWIITLVFTLWRINADFLDGPKTFAHLYGLHTFANLKLYAEHPLYRLYTFLATLPVYLKLLVWPTGLHMERSFSIYTALGRGPVVVGLALVLVSAFYIGIRARRSTPSSPFSWGLIWFAAAHSPDSGLLVPMNALFLEHWMYLPSLGLMLGTGESVSRFVARRGHTLAAMAAVATLSYTLVLATMTYRQNEIWRDPPSFYNNIFKYGDESARARNNLALYYADNNDYADAITQFKRAIAVSDSYAETRHNLALIYLREPDQSAHVQSAIENLKRAIEIEPGFYRSYLTLGDVYGIILRDADKAAYYHDRGEELKRQRE